MISTTVTTITIIIIILIIINHCSCGRPRLCGADLAVQGLGLVWSRSWPREMYKTSMCLYENIHI